MPSKAKLKAEHKTTFVAFNGGGSTLLGDRDDLDKLAIMAIQSGDKSLLNLFEQPLPSLDELKKSDVDDQLKKGPQFDQEHQKQIPVKDQEHELLNNNQSPDANAENKNLKAGKKNASGNK